MVASQNLARYSRKVSAGFWRMVKRLVAVTLMCFDPENCWMNFRWKSVQLSMEFFGKFMYHLNAASFKVPESSLHFRWSAAPMMAVWVPTAIRCSDGSVFPSNAGR
ncbi:hypothetical protein QL285_077656 [Trifolium repens]|nr:hypothetical protein QL285_077656 [Trifolium repens]